MTIGNGRNGLATRRAAAMLLGVLAFVAVSTTALVPRPAAAQLTVLDPVTGAATTTTVVKDTTSQIITEAAVIALVNGVNYFTSQLAYSAAVALTSECPGQGPCWDSKSFKSGFSQAWQGAIGESIGTLSEQTGLTALGFDLCKPDLNFTLRIQLGLLDELKPPKPRCDFNDIVSRWDEFTSVSSNEEILQGLKPTFEKGQAPLSVSLGIMDGLIDKKFEVQREKVMKSIMDASAGGGFSDITDPVSGRVKAPAAVTKDEFTRMKALQQDKPGEYSSSYAAGQIAAKAVTSVVLNAVQTFTQTLVARLWNKLANGLLSTEELVALQPDLILNPEGLLSPLGASGVTQFAQTRFDVAKPRDTGLIDPMLDFSVCPTTNRRPNNCVLDQQFASAVRVADATPVTVRSALQKGLLHGDWPLYPSTNQVKDQDPFCYTYGYCESNLRKLRAARIISVGWEIATAKANANGTTTLKEVVDGFNDCNASGQIDASHRWCHLIDPDWVLKAPPAQCRAMAFGPTLLSSDIAARVEQCVDTQTCLKQDDSGACVGGWGYCAKERNVWRFNGDMCPAAFNSCRTLTTRTGGTVNYLLNTIDSGVCNADNAGCQQYSLEQNVIGLSLVGLAGAADDWKTSPARFLNRSVQTCDPTNNGCSALFKLNSTQSLNLIRNASFEETEDGDNDLTPDHARYWTPTGRTLNNVGGSLSKDSSHSVHGSNAVLLPLNASTSSQTCSDAICQNDLGCPCQIGAGALNGFACKIAKGQTSCPVTNRVSQDGISLSRNTTYTLSYTLLPNVSGGSVNGDVFVRVQNADGVKIDLTSGQVITSVADSATTTCARDASNNLRARTSATVPTGSSGIRASCTFVITAPGIASASVYLEAASGTNFIDDIQLEEGGGTEFHEGYGSVDITAPMPVKVAPAYLGCTGDDSDRAECASFAGVCRDNEVGCDKFTPTNGDPWVPGIVGAQDRCPAQCVGYDVFKQEASAFDAEKFPEYFIPSTARSCSAAEVGCSEFTNVDNEAVAYYTSLRLCVQPTDATAQTFYSWEGSDTTGFQLRTWSLKTTTGTSNATSVVSPSASDVAVSGSPADVGPAPCTALDGAATACASVSQAIPGGSAVGLCSRAAIDAGDFDCREFYDATGNRHYRLLSKTIIASASCSQHRITSSTQPDCAKSGGRWDIARSACVYSADVGLSTQCAAQQNGCRAYKGNAASNVRLARSDDFEGGIVSWTGNTSISSESVNVGGHSLKITSAGQARLSLSGSVAPLRSYSMSFWARGTGSLAVSFAAGAGATETPISAIPAPVGSLNFADAVAATVAPDVALTSQWKRFELGPVVVAAPAAGQAAWGTYPSDLRLALVGASADAFIDNVELREVQDNIFVVRNSWNTPLACDQTLSGVSSPQEMLGCRAYQSQTQGSIVTLRSFSQLCREKAIGCSAYSFTQNTIENPYSETFNAVCKLPAACGSGGVTPDAGSNCICNFTTGNAAFSSAVGSDVLGDVCRVAVGETECHFNLDGIDDSTTAAADPDRVVVPADKRIYLVGAELNRCDAGQISCKMVGRPHLTFEAACTLPSSCANAAGCTCTLPTGSCTVIPAEQSCTVSFQNAIIDRWENVHVKDDPARYAQTLCNAAAMSCEEYTAADGTFYFKNPGDQICEFKEGVVFGGHTVSGFFRKSETGALFPCAPSLLKNGNFYAMYRNADPAYEGWVGQCETRYDRCEEFIDPNRSNAANPAGEPYYYIVNAKMDLASCAGKGSLKDGCVLFKQTSKTQDLYSAAATYARSDAEAFGGSVAPLNCNGANPNPLCGSSVNDTNVIIKVRQDRECSEWLACTTSERVYDAQLGKFRARCTDFTQCSASASQLECSQVIEPAKKVFTADDYVSRDVSWSGDEFSGYTVPARFPAQYLKPVMIVEGRCFQTVGCDPGVSSCAIEPYDACGDSSECSGVPGAFCQQMTGFCKLDQIGHVCDKNEECGTGYCSKSYADTHRFGVLLDPTYSCTRNADCTTALTGQVDAGNGTCVQDRCYYNYAGGAFTKNDTSVAAQCRAYPEDDSPYGSTVVNANEGGINLEQGYDRRTFQAVSKDAGFGGANTCTFRNDCECSYKRVQYGAGAGIVRFVGASNPLLPKSFDLPDNFNDLPNSTSDIRNIGICSGGPHDGWTCDPNNQFDNSSGGSICTVGTDVGSCVKPTRVSTILGWQGFCMDSDKSVNINGDANQFNCNLWLPVDQLAGAPDNFNLYREAGFQPDMQELLYCAVAKGNMMAPDYTSSNSLNLKTTGSGDKQAVATLDFSANGWSKDQITAAVIEFPDVNAQGIHSKMFLSDQNNWVDGFGYNNSNDDDQNLLFDSGNNKAPNANKLGQALGVGPDPDNCAQNYLNEDDSNSNTCFNTTDSCFAARLDFSGNALTGAKATVCNGDNESSDQRLTVTLHIFFREACNKIVQTFDSTKDQPDGTTSFAWTDRLWKAKLGGGAAAANLPASFTYSSTIGSVETNPSVVAPFGPISPPKVPVIIGSGSTAVTTLPFRWPIPLYKAQGGSAFTRLRLGIPGPTNSTPPCVASSAPVVNEADPSTAASYVNYCDTGYNLAAGDVGLNGDVDAPKSGQTFPAAGIPYACEGPCGFADSSNLDVNGTRPASAALTAYDRLSQIFAQGFGYFVWDTANNPDMNQPTYKRENQTTYDKRAVTVAPANKPHITPPLTGNCDAVNEGLCEESGADGFSIAGVTASDELSGVLVASGGRTHATFKYFAWADSNHMPLRRRIIDFGDASKPLETVGMFKNHRGCPSGRPCTAEIQECQPNSNDWGKTLQACENRYFQDVHTYTCTTGQVTGTVPGTPKLPACSPNDTGSGVYPCTDGTSCVFRPRIQFMDNWGVCNGSCPSGAGAGDVCFNEGRDPLLSTSFQTSIAASGTGANRNECVSLYNSSWVINSGAGTPIVTPWTAFNGVIKVKP